MKKPSYAFIASMAPSYPRVNAPHLLTLASPKLNRIKPNLNREELGPMFKKQGRCSGDRIFDRGKFCRQGNSTTVDYKDTT